MPSLAEGETTLRSLALGLKRRDSLKDILSEHALRMPFKIRADWPRGGKRTFSSLAFIKRKEVLIENPSKQAHTSLGNITRIPVQPIVTCLDLLQKVDELLRLGRVVDWRKHSRSYIDGRVG